MNKQTREALELAREVLEQSDPKWGERIRAMSAIDAALSDCVTPNDLCFGHASDCAAHNATVLPVGVCDCGFGLVPAIVGKPARKPIKSAPKVCK